mmetsp:Transcript_89793/g.187663  ORF Transcript_89793/g.187663 Transcript_89793/m.187663 type:complete len:250 (-) Transcript_89793:545-1294(-)
MASWWMSRALFSLSCTGDDRAAMTKEVGLNLATSSLHTGVSVNRKVPDKVRDPSPAEVAMRACPPTGVVGAVAMRLLRPTVPRTCPEVVSSSEGDAKRTANRPSGSPTKAIWCDCRWQNFTVSPHVMAVSAPRMPVPPKVATRRKPSPFCHLLRQAMAARSALRPSTTGAKAISPSAVKRSGGAKAARPPAFARPTIRLPGEDSESSRKTMAIRSFPKIVKWRSTALRFLLPTTRGWGLKSYGAWQSRP